MTYEHHKPTKRMPYKIETKPSLWTASVQGGCYSEWNIDYYHIHANSEEEAWHLFCRFWDEQDKEYSLMWFYGIKDEWSSYSVMDRFIPKIVRERKDFDIEDIDWDHINGYTAKAVHIFNTEVIHFPK